MEDIKAIIEFTRDIGVDGWNALKTIGTFLNYLLHPSLIIKALWTYTNIYAYWVCLFIAIFALILNGIGYKKFTKFIPGSIAIYSLIKLIGSVF